MARKFRVQYSGAIYQGSTEVIPFNYPSDSNAGSEML